MLSTLRLFVQMSDEVSTYNFFILQEAGKKLGCFITETENAKLLFERQPNKIWLNWFNEAYLNIS